MNHIAFYLRKVHFNRKSGQIIFKRGPVQKILFFQNGELVHVKTNVPEERLGEILLKLGKISEETYAQIERHLEPSEPIGESLSRKGLTSQRNVEEAVVHQIREVTLSLFSCFDGEFILLEKASLVRKDASVRVNVPYLIEDGIRRMKFHPALEEFLAKKIPYPKARTFQHILTEEEKRIFEAVKGEGTCRKLLDALHYNPEFFWKTLYLLYCLNMVDFRDKDEIPVEPGRPAEEEQLDGKDRLEEITAFWEKIQNMNYYQILRVGREASENEIKRAYFLLARRFHPDRFNRSIGPEQRKKVDEVFDAVTKAYRTLTDPVLREQYDSHAPGERPASARDFSRQADIKFRQAKTLYGLGRYEDAVILLEEAIRLKKDKADYFLLLAMTESKIPSFRRRAEEHFLKAAELEPWNAEAHAGLGLLYKSEGLPARAKRCFQRALELDASHELAQRELEALAKGKKKKGLKSFFSLDLFGSKKK